MKTQKPIIAIATMLLALSWMNPAVSSYFNPPAMDGVMGKTVYAFGGMTGVDKTKNGAIKNLLRLIDDQPKRKGFKDKDFHSLNLILASLGPLKKNKNIHWPDIHWSDVSKWNKDDKLSAVPVPAAFWLFGTALIGFIGMSRRTKV